MKLLLSLFSALLLAGLVAQARTVRLDQIDIKDNYVQDWGLPQINRSVARSPLSIGGKVYKHGLGTHAISRFLYDVTNASRVKGLAGPDDNNMFATRMEFKLIGDGRLLWRSGVMTRDDKAKEFDVNLDGVDKLLFLVDMSDDEFMYDHANWVDVKFTTNGGDVVSLPVWPKPVEKEPYILTPASPQYPVINNPKVYGASPRASFMWSIMATGEQPIAYDAHNLPQGLTLDHNTGIISGSVDTAGDYPLTLIASNSHGADSCDVVIKIGQGIALTPVMGWSSWNSCRFDASDNILRNVANIMATQLHPYGWSYVIVDDGWMEKQRDHDGVLHGNSRFPDMKGLADYIHDRGLKFGLYSSPGPTTCGGYPASWQHENLDALTWARWGVDYLKYDYCSHTLVEEDSSEASISAPYHTMRHALNETGRDIVYCVGYGAPNVWNWAPMAGGNQWRTTRDITDQWNVMLAIANCQDVCAPSTVPGRFNDPDMMVVGTVGKGWGQKGHPSLLTPDEQYTHVSLWALLSAPMILGCEMDKLDDFTLSLLTNREVIAVNQDTLCAPARKFTVENGQVWAKPLSDGSVAVGMFNIDPYQVLWNQEEAEAMQYRLYDIAIDLAQLGISGKVRVRDLWRNIDIAESTTGTISSQVPYHGVKLLRLIPE